MKLSARPISSSTGSENGSAGSMGVGAGVKGWFSREAVAVRVGDRTSPVRPHR